MADRRAKVAQLLLHQQPGAGLGHQSHDRFDRRVRAMRRAERIVHVDVAQCGQPLREAGIVLLFLGVVAQVLEQHDAAGGRAAHGGLGRGADTVFGERHGATQQLTRSRGDRAQAHVRIRLALGTAEMRGQDHASRARVERVSDRRQRLANASVVADDAALERDVEVDADEHASAFQVEVANRSFCHGRFQVPESGFQVRAQRPRATSWRSRSTQRLE